MPNKPPTYLVISENFTVKIPSITRAMELGRQAKREGFACEVIEQHNGADYTIWRYIPTTDQEVK